MDRMTFRIVKQENPPHSLGPSNDDSERTVFARAREDRAGAPEKASVLMGALLGVLAGFALFGPGLWDVLSPVFVAFTVALCIVACVWS